MAIAGNGQSSFSMQDVALEIPVVGNRFYNVMGGFIDEGTIRDPARVPRWLPKVARYPCRVTVLKSSCHRCSAVRCRWKRSSPW